MRFAGEEHAERPPCRWRRTNENYPRGRVRAAWLGAYSVSPANSLAATPSSTPNVGNLNARTGLKFIPSQTFILSDAVPYSVAARTIPWNHFSLNLEYQNTRDTDKQ